MLHLHKKTSPYYFVYVEVRAKPKPWYEWFIHHEAGKKHHYPVTVSM